MLQDQMRPAVWILFIMLCAMLWFRWVAANRPHPITPAQTQQTTGQTASPAPALEETMPELAPDSSTTNNAVPARTMNTSAELITVQTDEFELAIDPKGGQVVKLSLTNYKESVDSDKPFVLLEPTTGQAHMIQSGVIGNDIDSSRLTFSADKSSYALTGDTLDVRLTAQDNGLTFVKNYVFKRGEFDFTLKQTVVNQSSTPWSGFQFRQMYRSPVEASFGIGQIYTYTGGVVSSQDSNYEKVKFDDMASEDLRRTVDGGWAAMIQHYFLSAVVPNAKEKNLYYSRKMGNGDLTLGLSSGKQTADVGGETAFSTTFYVGPKITKKMANVAPHLDKTVDFGYFYFISEWLFKFLAFVQSFVGNWGWAIVVVTIVIKLIFFPLSAYSYRSMAKMRKFQPEMERMRKQYGDDRQKLGQETMKLYQREKINPASGCLPMLVQIPVFLAFYFMLMEAVELRQAPWILWIKDLSVRDPYFVLPVINAALMFIQQKLNPPPTDPLQRKIMTYLPLVFGFMFMFFPAGLVLYWSVSNAFSIIQQRVINKRYGVAD